MTSTPISRLDQAGRDLEAACYLAAWHETCGETDRAAQARARVETARAELRAALEETATPWKAPTPPDLMEDAGVGAS